MNLENWWVHLFGRVVYKHAVKCASVPCSHVKPGENKTVCFNVGGAPAVIWLTKRSPDSQGGDVPLIFPVLLSWCDSVVKNIPDKGCEKATAYRDIHELGDSTPEGVETNQGKENFSIVKCELLIWENSTILWHHSLLFCEPVQVPKKCHTSCRGSSLTSLPSLPAPVRTSCVEEWVQISSRGFD